MIFSQKSWYVTLKLNMAKKVEEAKGLYSAVDTELVIMYICKSFTRRKAL